jgi:hypothetical protein
MVARQLAALPVEAFIHVENCQVTQADLLTVHDFGKWLIPASRTTGYDRAGRQVLCVVARDEVRKFAGHEGTHRRRIGSNAERHFAGRMFFKIAGRDAAPAVELFGSDGVHE